MNHNPVDVEAASIPAHLRTIIAHAKLGAPEPPIDSLAKEYKTGSANETDISPALARSLTRMMRARTIALRMQARRNATKRCRRGHLLIAGNLVGGRCRECKNAPRRKVA